MTPRTVFGERHADDLCVGPAVRRECIRADPKPDFTVFAELEQVKPGAVMVVLTDVDPVDDPLILRNAVLLKEPHAGVKLPGDKK